MPTVAFSAAEHRRSLPNYTAGRQKHVRVLPENAAGGTATWDQLIASLAALRI